MGVCGASGGSNDENTGKTMEMEEDEEIMTILESMVTRELTIPTVITEFSKEATD